MIIILWTILVLLQFGQVSAAPTLSFVQDYDCRISKIELGSSYEHIVSVLGEPLSERKMDPPTRDAPTRTMRYAGLFIQLVNNKVRTIEITGPEHRLASGLTVGSTEEEVLGAYGATDGKDDRGEIVGYEYNCLGENGTTTNRVLRIDLRNGVIKHANIRQIQ